MKATANKAAWTADGERAARTLNSDAADYRKQQVRASLEMYSRRTDWQAKAWLAGFNAANTPAPAAKPARVHPFAGIVNRTRILRMRVRAEAQVAPAVVEPAAKPVLDYVPATSLRVGDIAHFHGARFEIFSTTESRSHIDGFASAYGSFREFVGPSPVAAPYGRWLDGEQVEGYFGEGKTWVFQGNARHVVAIERRAK